MRISKRNFQFQKKSVVLRCNMVAQRICLLTSMTNSTRKDEKTTKQMSIISVEKKRTNSFDFLSFLLTFWINADKSA